MDTLSEEDATSVLKNLDPRLFGSMGSGRTVALLGDEKEFSTQADIQRDKVKKMK